MAAWTLTLDLSQASEQALFVRIANALAQDIARGRLRPGDRLPGTRRLAQSLGVHRNTAVAAYAELESQGWTNSHPSRGTFVSDALPAESKRELRQATTERGRVPARTSYDLAPNRWGEPAEPPTTKLLPLGGGMPDPRLAPRVLLARAYRRAMQNFGAAGLDYADSFGHAGLRQALARMLSSTRGIATGGEDILVTRGSQMALWLIAQVLLQPGDRVVVESFGYRPAWEALEMTGAQVCPVGLDARGIDMTAFEAELARGPIRAVYLTPHHQYPTTATLSPERRARLLELARKHRFAIIEDDYDNEFHYEGRPLLPMASVDRSGAIIYVGTLSKVLAPGIRVGWVVAPQPLLRRMAALRTRIDRQGDHVLQAAVAELMEDGEVQRHVWRMKRTYELRRDTAVEALRELLSDTLEFESPKGGMALWAHTHGVDTVAWQRRCRERGVEVSIGKQYAFDGRPRPNLRVGFARATPEELIRGIETLAAARPVRRGRAR